MLNKVEVIACRYHRSVSPLPKTIQITIAVVDTQQFGVVINDWVIRS